jgi:hypothetical protein
VKAFVVLTVVLALSTPATAEQLDSSSEKALQQTKEFLKDKSLREQSLKDNDSGRRADEYTKGLGTNTDEVYSLSAEILEDITRQAGGDPVKMQEIMSEAQRNPAAFAAKFSDKQKAKIKELAQPIKPVVQDSH